MVIVPQSNPISRLKLLLASTTRASMLTWAVTRSIWATIALACLTFSAMSVKMIWLLRSSTVTLPRSLVRILVRWGRTSVLAVE